MIKTERVPTGIEGLDQRIEGGLPKGRSILVTGEPGTGKTIFALQFLVEGLKRGEKCMFVTADEGPLDVLEQAASLGWDLDPHVESKELSILNAGSYLSSLPGAGRERHIDVQKAVGDLASFVNQIGVQRLVLDPAGPFVLLRDSAVRIPVGRLGTSEEVAQAVLMVIGNAYMTGQTVYADGGRLALTQYWDLRFQEPARAGSFGDAAAALGAACMGRCRTGRDRAIRGRVRLARLDHVQVPL